MCAGLIGAGCASDGASDVDSASAGQVGTNEAAGGSTEASTLDFPNWVWGTPDNAPFFAELKSAYEDRYPGVRVTDEVIPGGEYQDKAFSMMAAGTPPDLVTPFDPALRAWMREDLLEPLDPWLEEAGYDLDSFIPPNRMAQGEDGKIYGVIYVSNPRVMFTNTNLLDEAGVDLPSTPEELFDVAQAVRNLGGQKFGYATMSTSASAFPTYGEILPIIKGFGGDIYRDGVAVADSEETVEALSFIKRLHDEDLIPRGQDETVYRESFAQGNVASIVVGAFIMAIVQSKNPDLFDSYTATQNPFGTNRTTAANGFLAIPKDAADKDAAAQFILMLLEDEWQERIVEMSWQVPARPDMIPDGFLDEHPWFQTMLDAVPHAESLAPEGLEDLTPEIQEIVTQHFQSMLLGGLSPEAAAENMQADLVRISS